MNLKCKIFGHKYAFARIIEGGGLFSHGKMQMPLKEYKCERCSAVIAGVGIEEKDHKQMMAYAREAKREAGLIP